MPLKARNRGVSFYLLLTPIGARSLFALVRAEGGGGGREGKNQLHENKIRDARDGSRERGCKRKSNHSI